MSLRFPALSAPPRAALSPALSPALRAALSPAPSARPGTPPRAALHAALHAPLRALLALALLLAQAGAAHAGEEKLVPAQFSQRSDTAGGLWDFQPNGFVSNGNNDCFDNGAMLLLNGRDFNAQERKQTVDGDELVLFGRVEQLTVVRRVLVDKARNAARFLEVVTNTGKQKQQVVLEVRSNLGGQAMQSVWQDGRPAGGPLPKKCAALAAIHQPGQSRPGVIWIIGEPNATTPPTIDVANQHVYHSRYTFDLAPQQTRAVLHYVLQRPGLQAAQVAEAVKPLWKGTLVKPVLPPAYKSLLVNFRLGAAGGSDPATATPVLPTIGALLERAGVDDTGGRALVGVGRSEAERMSGTLSGGPLLATTEFGAVTIPLAELAGSEGSGFRTLLHLRSGETLSTATLSGDLRLETEAGVDLPVEPARVAWLVTPQGKGDGTVAADQAGVLLLTDGSRLALTASTPALPLISSFGQAAVAIAQLARIERVSEPPGWLAVMRDGSRLHVLPTTSESEVATCRHGPRRVLTARIAGWLASGLPPDQDLEREDGAHLDNGECFLGGLAGTTVTIHANGADTAIPVERITAIECPPDTGGLAVVLRDGGRLVGTTSDGSVALLAGGQTWRVPIRRLSQWQAPAPPEPPPEDDEPAAQEGKTGGKNAADAGDQPADGLDEEQDAALPEEPAEGPVTP